MSKAFGFNEKAHIDMSTTLTGLAGDVASFYNISQDEAYTKLKSVFTGETESLKDLGVVMTQTALDSYALIQWFRKDHGKDVGDGESRPTVPVCAGPVNGSGRRFFQNIRWLGEPGQNPEATVRQLKSNDWTGFDQCVVAGD